MAMRKMWAVALVVVCCAAGCVASGERPSYARSKFAVIVAAETYSLGSEREMSEKDVQTEVDRLMALRPATAVPARVLLYEVPSGGMTKIVSARKMLVLHKETSDAMKGALEKTGIFASIDFLPDVYLTPGNPGGLKSLRIAAARAHADGLLMYTTEAGYEYEPTDWAWLYSTIIGVCVVPGSRGSAMAISKAVLVDVKTGYIYRVLEGYGETSVVCPFAALDEEQLEFDARKQALAALAALTAEKVKELGAAK